MTILSSALVGARATYMYATVFLASACVLSLETVAVRLIAPFIGVSIYTWSAVIMVVLAGLSIGNYIGGKMGDRAPHMPTLTRVLLLSGLTSIMPLIFTEASLWAFQNIGFLSRLIVTSIVILLPPSVAFGMITPVVIRLMLQNMRDSGRTVGQFYATSTAGSILGIFLTGFFLIQTMGSNTIIFFIATMMACLAFLTGQAFRGGTKILTVVGAVSILAVPLTETTSSQGMLTSNCFLETNYYCVNLIDDFKNGNHYRVMKLDSDLHSSSNLQDPQDFYFKYLMVYRDVVSLRINGSEDERVLVLGGGGYTFPRYIESRYPLVQTEVIEIDPSVTETAKKYMGLDPETLIISYNSDARMVVESLPTRSYDIVLGDAFSGKFSIPYHLTTVEFNEEVRRLLKDDGIYVVNIIDDLQPGGLLATYARTLGKTFPFVYVAYDTPDGNINAIDNFVVIGSIRDLRQGNPESLDLEGLPSVRLLEDEDVLASISTGSLIFDDDHNPADNMIADMLERSHN